MRVLLDTNVLIRWITDLRISGQPAQRMKPAHGIRPKTRPAFWIRRRLVGDRRVEIKSHLRCVCPRVALVIALAI